MVAGERADHTFTYALFFWDMSDYEELGEGYWCVGDGEGIFADLESAVLEGRWALQSKSAQREI